MDDQLTVKRKELERVAHEADDARDEMRSLQAKSKQMATDLEKIKADQIMELKGECKVASCELSWDCAGTSLLVKIYKKHALISPCLRLGPQV